MPLPPSFAITRGSGLTDFDQAFTLAERWASMTTDAVPIILFMTDGQGTFTDAGRKVLNKFRQEHALGILFAVAYGPGCNHSQIMGVIQEGNSNVGA